METLWTLNCLGHSHILFHRFELLNDLFDISCVQYEILRGYHLSGSLLSQWVLNLLKMGVFYSNSCLFSTVVG